MPIPSLAPNLKRRALEPSSRPAGLDKPLPDPPPEEAAEGAHASRLPTHAKRSFLPQPGDVKPPSRRPGTGDAKDSTQTRPRPRSLYQSNTARTDQVLGRGEAHPRGQARVPAVAERSAAAQPGSALRRAPSLRNVSKPTTPNTQPPASPRPHLRTQSTSTVTGTSTEPRTLKERPKSLLIPRSASVKVVERSAVDTASSSSNTARIAALRRTASVRTRGETTPAAESRGPTPRSGLSNVQAHAVSLSRTREPQKEGPNKPSRPAFSTLQQHFTPRKVGKALTSTFLQSSAPEAGANAIGLEIASIQAELLQLHLLHQASAETTRLWELSARRALEGQFEAVKSLHQVLRDEERHGQEQQNIRALRDWTMGSSSRFAEHIQTISGPMQELPLLVDSGGRFQSLVEEFQQWIAHVERTWADRDGEGQMTNGLDSAGALGDAWKAENAALVRKLTSFSHDLSRLTQPAPGSSIARVVTSCQQLVQGLLEELFTMNKIENDVVAREREWVEESLKAIGRGGGVSAEFLESDVAWRS